MSAPPTVAILGLGLMGGSLARALRETREPPVLHAWAPDASTIVDALAAGIVDAAPRDLAAAIGDADLIVLAAPVGASIALLHDVARASRPGAIVTDVCSVKTPLMQAAAKNGLGARFVGGHPLTGSHRSGWNASRADLYRAARVFLTPSPEEAANARVEAFWSALDAVPEFIEPNTHDELMAHVSHVPQVVASAIAAALAGAGIPPAKLGPGGRDVTRIAGSSPELWTDILSHNAAVGPALAMLQTTLDRFAEALAAGDEDAIRRLLEIGHTWSVQ